MLIVRQLMVDIFASFRAVRDLSRCLVRTCNRELIETTYMSVFKPVVVPA